MLLHKQATTQVQQLFDPCYITGSQYICQGTALMIWGYMPLDEEVFESSIASKHFLMDLLVAVSME